MSRAKIQLSRRLLQDPPDPQPPSHDALHKVMVVSKAVGSAIWPLWPTGFVAGCWATLLWPDVIREKLPKLPWLLPGPKPRDPAAQVFLPKIFPKQCSAAWQLGALTERWQAGKITEEKLLADATQILALDARTAEGLTGEALATLGEQLKERERPSGVWSKVAGLISFANLLWVVGVVGVLLFLWPALDVMLGPLLAWMLRVARTSAMWTHALLSPFYGAATFGASFYVVAAAQRYVGAADTTLAPMLALTGVATGCLALVWEMVRYGFPRHGVWHFGLIRSLGPLFFVYAFLLLSLVPLAVLHQSRLAGFVAAGALFSAMGFVVIPFGMGWAVGWLDEDSMICTGIASALIICLLLGLRAARIESRALAPFHAGLSVFGSICLFLSGLIRCSAYYSGRWDMGGALGYASSNVIYALMLASTTGAGAYYGNNGVYSTGATFTFLYLSEKLVEITPEAFFFPLALAGSCVLIWLAYFLKSRPEWIASMLRQ